MAKARKPGEKAGKTGEYEERGPRGGLLPNPQKVTIDEVKDRLPPTQEKGRTWKRTGPPEK